MLGIVIPTYNRATHLHTLLEFFFTLQDYNWFELIVLDNHSNYDVETLISSYVERGMHIIFSSAEKNTGSMESNIARLRKINSFYPQKYTHMWVLGDDDLPIRESLCIASKLIPESPACIIYGKCFSQIGAESAKNKNEYHFESIGNYFKMLVEEAIYASEAGFTFVSNAILRTDIFTEVYEIHDKTYLDALPTNLTVLSQLCRLEAFAQKEINGAIIAVRSDLVRVAFKTIGGHSAVLKPSYTRLLDGEAAVSASYFRLRAFVDTWLAISPNVFKISQHHGQAVLWFYNHLEYFAGIIANSLFSSADEHYSCFEYHLFSAYLNRLYMLSDSQTLLKLKEDVARKRSYPVSFYEHSLGCDGFFCPMNGWIKGLGR